MWCDAQVRPVYKNGMYKSQDPGTCVEVPEFAI